MTHDISVTSQRDGTRKFDSSQAQRFFSDFRLVGCAAAFVVPTFRRNMSRPPRHIPKDLYPLLDLRENIKIRLPNRWLHAAPLPGNKDTGA